MVTRLKSSPRLSALGGKSNLYRVFLKVYENVSRKQKPHTGRNARLEANRVMPSPRHMCPTPAPETCAPKTCALPTGSPTQVHRPLLARPRFRVPSQPARGTQHMGTHSPILSFGQWPVDASKPPPRSTLHPGTPALTKYIRRQAQAFSNLLSHRAYQPQHALQPEEPKLPPSSPPITALTHTEYLSCPAGHQRSRPPATKTATSGPPCKYLTHTERPNPPGRTPKISPARCRNRPRPSQNPKTLRTQIAPPARQDTQDLARPLPKPRWSGTRATDRTHRSRRTQQPPP